MKYIHTSTQLTIIMHITDKYKLSFSVSVSGVSNVC